MTPQTWNIERTRKNNEEKETTYELWSINWFFLWENKKTIKIVKDKSMSFLKTNNEYSKKLRGKKSRKWLEDKSTRQIKAKINRELYWVRRRLL